MPCDSPSPAATAMTGHGPPAETESEASDTRWTLDQTFNHPAGLRTARHIVRALLERAEGPSDNIHSPAARRISQASHTLFGSNPAVMGELKEILAFRESQAPNMEQGGDGGQASSIPLGGGTDSGNRNDLPSSSPTSISTAGTLQYQRQPRTEEQYPTDAHAHLDTHFAVESRPPSTGPPTLSQDSEHTSRRHLLPSRHQQRLNDLQTEFPRRKPIGSIIERGDESTTSNISPLGQSHKTSPALTLFSSSASKTSRLSSGLAGLATPTSHTSSVFRSHPSSTTPHLIPPIDLTPNPTSRAGLDSFHTIKGFLPVNKSIETSHSTNKQPTQTHSLQSNLRPALGQEGALRRSISTDRAVSGTQMTSQRPVQSDMTPLSRQESTSTHLSPCQSSASSTSSTPRQLFSQRTLDFSLSRSFQGTMMKAPRKKMATRKRKLREDGESGPKKQKLSKIGSAGTKALKLELAKEQLGQDIWMRILEFTPPSFLKKARLINHSFKDMVDKFDSIFVNCRKENYGWDMPPPPPGMTERQYSDLLGGKGCQESGCDNKKATRTYWSWAKRWCSDCWEHRIEREDRILKSRSVIYNRTTLMKMLESIPVAIHDSFVKPHDYIDDVETRSRGPPRLYKCYLTDDLTKIMKEYEALTPLPYKDDPNHTPAQKSAALAAHKALMDALDDKRAAFFAAKKAKNDEHMGKVKKIEVAIRNKRQQERVPRDNARKSRIQLFTRRAQEDLPSIPVDFVQKTTAFKAACRIYRDGGTERGWRALKPKIEKEWETSDQNPANGTAEDLTASQKTAAGDADSGVDELEDFEMHNADDMDLDNDRFPFRDSRDHQVLPRPTSFSNMRSTPFVPGNLGSGSNHRNVFGLTSSHQSTFASAALPYPGQTVPNNHASSQSLLPPVAGYISLFSQANQSAVSSNLAGLPRPNPASLGVLSTHIPVNSLLRPPTPAGTSKCYPSI